ncbi:MAG: DUF1064 domain-containing protein [Prevotella sp.]|nr:DUF1064 domain-containing protein [Prevotella sp.]
MRSRMKADEFQALYGSKSAVNKAKPKNKYHAQKVNGYDSKKEYNRAMELKTYEKLGLIRNLQEQVPFTLVPAHRDENGNLLERAVTYKADFVYYDTRKKQTIVEDTKGVRTKEYIIKRKLMLHVHNIRITEI